MGEKKPPTRPHPHTSIPFAVFLLCLILLPVVAAHAQANGGTARLKDLADLEGAAPMQLTGYGLVVGLDRTGDRARGKRGAPYTVQSITNMLRQFGITVDPAVLSSRNVAAVMVTATMNRFSGVGNAFDVTVSSLGDARSLSIAAASIAAKVTRDRAMALLARRHPGFGWERNAGYGTAQHRAALAELGVTAHHRRSFKPIAALLRGGAPAAGAGIARIAGESSGPGQPAP